MRQNLTHQWPCISYRRTGRLPNHPTTGAASVPWAARVENAPPTRELKECDSAENWALASAALCRNWALSSKPGGCWMLLEWPLVLVSSNRCTLYSSRREAKVCGKASEDSGLLRLPWKAKRKVA